MNYELMSDFEINKAVAETDKKFKSCIDVEFFMSDGNDGSVDVVSQGILICTANYCTDVNYAWPVIESIFSKGVTLMINDTGVTTSNLGEKYNGKSFDVNCKPLRAAMIVFLKIQGGK